MRILVASLPVSWAPPLSCVAFILLCAGCAGGLPPVAVAAQRHNDAGTELLAGNHLDDAEARFRLALEYHPHFAEAHLNLGLLLLARGRRSEVGLGGAQLVARGFGVGLGRARRGPRGLRGPPAPAAAAARGLRGSVLA